MKCGVKICHQKGDIIMPFFLAFFPERLQTSMNIFLACVFCRSAGCVVASTRRRKETASFSQLQDTFPVKEEQCILSLSHMPRQCM